MGWLGDLDKATRRQTIGLVIARTEGNLVKAAHQLGIQRSHLYRLITQDQLWPVINRARRRRLEDQAHTEALNRRAKSWEIKRRRRWFHAVSKGSK